jgi:hypothetical protein
LSDGKFAHDLSEPAVVETPNVVALKQYLTTFSYVPRALTLVMIVSAAVAVAIGLSVPGAAVPLDETTFRTPLSLPC